MLLGLTLKNVKLVTGNNTINHTLARNLQGWMIVRRNTAATVYDTQDTNVQKDRTLTLVASAAVMVDIFVY